MGTPDEERRNVPAKQEKNRDRITYRSKEPDVGFLHVDIRASSSSGRIA